MSEKQSSKIQFHFLSKVSILRNRTKLKSFIERLLKNNGKKTDSIHFIFCSDEYLLDINKRFLKHDFYTDIITFDLSEGTSLVAEIYISIDRVYENAKSYNTTVSNELHRVMFHGILHLCGFKDKTSKDRAVMRAAELQALNSYYK